MARTNRSSIFGYHRPNAQPHEQEEQITRSTITQNIGLFFRQNNRVYNRTTNPTPEPPH